MDQTELSYMRIAIELAAQDSRPVKVGAVIVKDGEIIQKAHGAEISTDEHAEYTLLERKLMSTNVTGATLYCTLEPCTITYHPTNPRKTCAEIVKQRRISRIVIGIRDPNPDIYDTGVIFLKKHGVSVDFFPEELQREIENLMPDWIREQKSRRQVPYKQLFANLAKHRSPRIDQYTGVGVGDALTLRMCPIPTEGWLMSKVKMHPSNELSKFTLPLEEQAAYQDYFLKNYDVKGFETDNPKIMLRRHPRSFTDAPSLTLHTQETLYSHIQYYKDMIANNFTKSDFFIKRVAVEDDRVAEFPHALCLHLIIITSDGKVLITKRAPEVEYSPNTWSCSIEENMALKDLENGADEAIFRWGKRALFEELGIAESSYTPDNLRVLSVFLEADILNISLCGHVVLNIPYDRLEQIIRVLPRLDYEFTAWSYLPFKDDEMIAQILNPSLAFHPTSRYRMLMALIKKNGIPRGAEESLQ